MQANRGKLAKRRDELAARSEESKRELVSARYELDVATGELQNINNELASLKAERRTTENAAAQLELLRRGISGDSETRAKALADMEAGQRARNGSLPSASGR